MRKGEFLDKTVVVDLSQVTKHPLVYMLSERGPSLNSDKRSMVDEKGAVANAWDWAIESSDALVDKQGVVVSFLTTYVLPADDQEFLVGHSLGSVQELGANLDLVTKLMRLPEHGNRVCALIEQQWPKTWHLLREGAGMPNNFGLIKVRTNQDHWFVGGFLLSRDPTVVDVDQAAVDRFRDMAFDVMDEILGFPANLPGLRALLASDRQKQLEDFSDKYDFVVDMLKQVSEVLR